MIYRLRYTLRDKTYSMPVFGRSILDAKKNLIAKIPDAFNITKIK